MTAEPKQLAKSLSKLSLNQEAEKTTAKSKKAAKKQNVVDSWEDEELSSGEETDRPLSHQASADYPSAPPPTPISPIMSSGDNFTDPYGYSAATLRSPQGERSSARPEKTDAVAKRLIAGALGVRAPKKTDEQRAYDRAIKEKEMKRRNDEKEAIAKAKEAAEKAKAAVWDD
ncbi:hypothetical protein BP6252_09887 [Coleophoma cylindrospora]|uniref:Ubiquitin-like protein smt3 n=1 Tax=Coleophoma cylindrospora TaxID=1849047 RepID=A0A3D8QWT5_9HELO|nr:hypothetical protein BP6252_09887 [Coleophoma cylindrospora]